MLSSPVLWASNPRKGHLSSPRLRMFFFVLLFLNIFLNILLLKKIYLFKGIRDISLAIEELGGK